MNRFSSLQETLDSIFNTNFPKEQVEVIIIDNASTDGTIKQLNNYIFQKKLHNTIYIIQNTSNLGFAKPLNQGIKIAKGKYILITNDDVIFTRKSISELVKLAEGKRNIGLVGPKMLFRDQKIPALSGFRYSMWLGYHPYDRQDLGTVREMDIATGGGMLVPKKVFKKVGLFDEQFFFCGEDYDICYRLKKAGYKILYCPSAIVEHEFLNSSSKNKSFQSLYMHYRGKFRFMLLHASLLQILTFFPVQFTLGIIYSNFISHQKTIKPMFAALFWNIKMLPNILSIRTHHEII